MESSQRSASPGENPPLSPKFQLSQSKKIASLTSPSPKKRTLTTSSPSPKKSSQKSNSTINVGGFDLTPLQIKKAKLFHAIEDEEDKKYREIGRELNLETEDGNLLK